MEGGREWAKVHASHEPEPYLRETIQRWQPRAVKRPRREEEERFPAAHGLKDLLEPVY
jgi:hypothetical protein